jgi:hypothetical protein
MWLERHSVVDSLCTSGHVQVEPLLAPLTSPPLVSAVSDMIKRPQPPATLVCSTLSQPQEPSPSPPAGHVARPLRARRGSR